jgi:hypothetical protein
LCKDGVTDWGAGFVVNKVLGLRFVPNKKGDIFDVTQMKSSCMLTQSFADLNCWTVDAGGRLLMELPTVPTGSDDPDMPLDLRRQCLLMFRQPGTHTYTPLRRLARDGGSSPQILAKQISWAELQSARTPPQQICEA